MEELILLILQAVLEFLGEALLESGCDELCSFFLHHLCLNAERKPHNPWAATFGYLMLGQGAGWLSWWALPHHFITDLHLRFISVFVTPAITGIVACAIGALWTRRGHKLVALDRFGYAYAFSFSIALARYAGSVW